MALRFGLIGCGNVSATYAYVLQNNPSSRVEAVADINQTKAQNLADTFGIKKVYADYQQMLAQEQLEAMVICTPHYLHHEQAIACARYGLPLLCEKPLATTMADIGDMIRHYYSRSLIFTTMLQRRCYLNTIRTAEAVRPGLLGRIEKVHLDFSGHKSADFYNSWRGQKISGGGVLLSQALHRIDQLVAIFGEPESVSGETKITRPYLEVEDYAQGTIAFKNGINVDLEANNSSGNPETKSVITVQGTKGKIVLSDDKTPEWNVKGLAPPEELDINAIPTTYRPAYYGPGHEIIINDFVEAVRDKRQPLITAADSLPAMKIIWGFYESSTTNKPVLLNRG